MDKLKPVLVHKFWILCALALVLPPSGWFLGARQLVSESLDRKTQLESMFSKAKVSDTVPNPSWANAVKKRAVAQEFYFRAAAAKLWNTQKRLMVWPTTVASLMAGSAYRKPADDQLTAANNFRSAYYAYLRGVWTIVDPASDVRPVGRARSKGHVGKIVLEWGTIPMVSEGTWQELPPTAEEMWDAQEDVWLVTAILRSIAKVNQSATNIADASIRRIDTLQLMGGNRDKGDTQMAGDGMDAGMSGMEMFGSAGATVRQSGGSAVNASVDFPPEDEFGSPAGKPVTDPDADGASAAGAIGMGPAGMVGATGMEMQAIKERRYIDDDPDMPFRTRGFYIKVLMDHRRLPELVAALTNSPFPVEIVRIHQQDSTGDVDRLGNPAGRDGRGSRSAASSRMGLGFGRRTARQPGFGGGFQPRDRRAVEGLGRRQSDENDLDPEAEQMIKTSLADPELSYVTLQGLMTLYLPPKFEQKVAEGEAAPTTGTPGTPSSNSKQMPSSETADESAPAHPPLPASPQPAAGTKSAEKTSGQTPSAKGPPQPGRPPLPTEKVPRKATSSGSGKPPQPDASAAPK